MALVLPFDPLSLKFALFVQLVVAFFSNLDGNYAFNLVAFAILLFAVYKDADHEPVLAGLCLLGLTVLLDVIVLSVYGHDRIHQRQAKSKYTHTTRFCLGLTILNLILKPWTMFKAYQEFRGRGGSVGATLRQEPAYASVPHPEPSGPGLPPYQPTEQAKPGYDGGYQAGAVPF